MTVPYAAGGNPCSKEFVFFKKCSGKFFYTLKLALAERRAVNKGFSLREILKNVDTDRFRAAKFPDFGSALCPAVKRDQNIADGINHFRGQAPGFDDIYHHLLFGHALHLDAILNDMFHVSLLARSSQIECIVCLCQGDQIKIN